MFGPKTTIEVSLFDLMAGSQPADSGSISNEI